MTPHILSQTTCYTNETLFVHGKFTKAEGKRLEESVCMVPLYVIGRKIGNKHGNGLIFID